MAKKTDIVSTKSKPMKKRRAAKFETTRNEVRLPFKSAYVCFSLSKQDEVTKALGPSSSIDDIANELARIWKHYSDEERSIWEKESKKDRERYQAEKFRYSSDVSIDGEEDSLGIDSSAFVYYLQKMLPSVKNKYPSLTFKRVQEMIEDMWKNTSTEDRKSIIREEKESRKWDEREIIQKEKAGDSDSIDKSPRSLICINDDNTENENYIRLADADTNTLRSCIQRYVDLGPSGLDGHLLQGTDINLLPLMGSQNLHRTNAAYVMNSAGGLSRQVIHTGVSASIAAPTFTIPSLVAAHSLSMRRQLQSQIPNSAYFIDYDP